MVKRPQWVNAWSVVVSVWQWYVVVGFAGLLASYWICWLLGMIPVVHSVLIALRELVRRGER